MTNGTIEHTLIIGFGLFSSRARAALFSISIALTIELGSLRLPDTAHQA